MNIHNYCEPIKKNFDISTIIINAKLNKNFHKLLNLCIRFNI
jgi:hypothetical protein